MTSFVKRIYLTYIERLYLKMYCYSSCWKDDSTGKVLAAQE